MVSQPSRWAIAPGKYARWAVRNLKAIRIAVAMYAGADLVLLAFAIRDLAAVQIFTGTANLLVAAVFWANVTVALPRRVQAWDESHSE